MDGTGINTARAADFQATPETKEVSVFASRPANHGAESGLDDRHHVYKTVSRLRLFDGGTRLVQSVRYRMGFINNTGQRILHTLRRGSTADQLPDNFQHGPGSTIHKREFHQGTGKSFDSNQYGRSRPGIGQHHDRTTLAYHKI